MLHWLCVTTEDNWKVIKEKNIWGVAERHKNTIAREVFRDARRIFKTPPGMGSESFPYRIKLEPLKVFAKPVDFKSLIPELKFITNKKRWSGHLMGRAMREIPEEDFELIMKAVS